MHLFPILLILDLPHPSKRGNKPISIPTFVPAAPFVLPETLVASPDRKWEANQPGEASTQPTTSLRLSKSDNEARRFSAWSNSANSRHFGWCKSFFMLFRLFHVRTMVTNYGKQNTALMWFDVQLLHSNSLASCLWTGRDIQLKDMSGERKLVEPVLETSADPYDPRNNVSSKQTQQRFLAKCKIRKICST